MDSIGAEVGQKMRSAIKAKLLELNCYVDDELPDYIMVMVANKRTKSQMNEDLNLFLSTKTSTFVDWLHIVLKKLKEVTVTNPEVYKKVTKRKQTDVPDVKVKKERKNEALIKEKKEQILNDEIEHTNSLTDNLPVNVNRLAEQRKITVVSESSTNNNEDVFDIPLLSQVDNTSSEKDLQDIEKKIRSVKSRLGLLVDSDLEEELPEIKTEKERLRMKQRITADFNYRTIHNQNDSNTENINKNIEPGLPTAEKSVERTTVSDKSVERRSEHKRITFEEESPPKKVSILDRLGSKPIDNSTSSSVKTRISLSEFRKEEEPFLKYFTDSKNEEKERDWRRRKEHRIERSRRENDARRTSPEGRRRDRSRDRRRGRSNDRSSSTRKEGILSRLGVMSKVSIPPKEPEEPEPENELKTREVRSMVQVKPRVIPTSIPQPNKNLLLKAVAEAQRSVSQMLLTGSSAKSNSLNVERTKEYNKHTEEVPHTRKFSQKEKNKLKNLILSHAAQGKTNGNENDEKVEEEYIPKPIKETPKEAPKYVPSSRLPEDLQDNTEIQQQFIITLDGAEKKLLNSQPRISVKDRLDKIVSSLTPAKLPVKSRLDTKKSPSPIIFDKVATTVNSKTNIPDKLPIVHPPLSIKNKERCKYWPSCRQGDKCEFVHPSSPCEMFPQCKFGDKCLYLHPTCKFGSSCTKRECPYSHLASAKLLTRSVSSGPSSLSLSAGLQTCKFFPNCTNSNCQFLHPKPCKFGKYCKNQSECTFSHFMLNKSSLIWRSK